MLFPVLYTLFGLCAGSAGMALIYERRIAYLDGEIARLAGKLYSSQMAERSWRDKANAIAGDLADLRMQLPRRDPRTNKFVKRAVNG